MRIRCPLGQALGFPRIPQGHRGKPREGQGPRKDEPAIDSKGNAEAGRLRDLIGALHLQVGRTRPPVLQADEKEGAIQVDSGG